jgi:hypothetical protein
MSTSDITCPLQVQDALAVAVADEMQKIYKKELEPLPVPSRVPADAVAVDEEDVSRSLYFFFLEC